MTNITLKHPNKIRVIEIQNFLSLTVDGSTICLSYDGVSDVVLFYCISGHVEKVAQELALYIHDVNTEPPSLEKVLSFGSETSKKWADLFTKLAFENLKEIKKAYKELGRSNEKLPG